MVHVSRCRHVLWDKKSCTLNPPVSPLTPREVSVTVSSNQPAMYFDFQLCLPCLPGKTHHQASPRDKSGQDVGMSGRKSPGSDALLLPVGSPSAEPVNICLFRKHLYVLTAMTCEGKICDESWEEKGFKPNTRVVQSMCCLPAKACFM